MSASDNSNRKDHFFAWREYHAALNAAKSRARDVLANASRRDEAESDLTRYFVTLEYALEQMALTEGEALYLGVVLRDIEFRESGIGAVHAVVSDDLLQDNVAEARGIDGRVLLQKIERAGTAGDLAIQDAFERAGELPHDDLDALARLRAARVVRG